MPFACCPIGCRSRCSWHCLAVADVVAPGIGRLCSGARRIFVFGLGQQPIGLAGHPGEPRHIALRVVPSDVDHRLPAAAPAAVDDMRVAIAIGDAGVPFVECQLELGHGKRFGDRTLCCGPSFSAALFVSGRSHRERSGRHHNHLRAVRLHSLKGVLRLQRVLGCCRQ